MKKIYLVIIMLVLIFLTMGCTSPNSSIDVTEVQTTEADIEEVDKTELSPEESAEPSSSEEDIVEMNFEKELKETDNPRIAELLNVSGIYSDGFNEENYHYQIPQFNANSEGAKVLNKRIEDELSEIIDEETANMSGGYSLISNSVTYEVFEYGDITAVVVAVPYPNDIMDYMTYTYDFKNNKEMTNVDLLAMRGVTDEEFVAEVCRLQEEDFIEMAAHGPNPITDQEIINEYVAVANEYASVDLPMYIDETGRLQVYIPCASIAGAEWYYHLRELSVVTTRDTLVEGESEETSDAFLCSEPAPSKEIIDRYGYVDGHSVLSFDIVAHTVEEYEGYYTVDAVFTQPIEVPGDLAIGERITVIFNELTGDERTIERREDGFYQLEDEENEPYYPTYFRYFDQEEGEPVVLYDENTDRVDKPVFDGKLYIRKDATIEDAIIPDIKPLTKEELNFEYNMWFDGVYFDENGYVTRLVYCGD